jgi:hypothetical protein
LATDIYAVTYGIKNADGILLGGFDMGHVSKDLSPGDTGAMSTADSLVSITWGQVTRSAKSRR